MKETMLITTSYNHSNPTDVSVQEVNVIKKVEYEGYTFCLHNSHNPMMGGCSFSEFRTGKNIKSYSTTITESNQDLIDKIVYDFEAYLFSIGIEGIKEKISTAEKFN